MPIEIANLFYLFDFFFTILVIIRVFLFYYSIRFRRFRSCSRIFWNISSDINRNAKEFFLTDINNFLFSSIQIIRRGATKGEWQWHGALNDIFSFFFFFFFFTVDKTGFRVDWYTRSRLIFHASQCFVAWWSLTPRHFYYPAYNRQIFCVDSFRFFLYSFLFFSLDELSLL